MPCCKNEEAPHKAVPRGLLAAIDPAAAVQISQQLVPAQQLVWSQQLVPCGSIKTAGPVTLLKQLACVMLFKQLVRSPPVTTVISIMTTGRMAQVTTACPMWSRQNS